MAYTRVTALCATLAAKTRGSSEDRVCFATMLVWAEVWSWVRGKGAKVGKFTVYRIPVRAVAGVVVQRQTPPSGSGDWRR